MSRGRLIIELTVGITVIVPLSHFPGFAALPPRAFKDLEIIGSGIGIHFPAIDADNRSDSMPSIFSFSQLFNDCSSR